MFPNALTLDSATRGDRREVSYGQSYTIRAILKGPNGQRRIQSPTASDRGRLLSITTWVYFRLCSLFSVAEKNG